MTNANLQPIPIGSEWLISTVADCLKMSAEKIERDVPLVRYGLDSLGAVQLITALSAKLQHDVPDSLLLYHPDVNSLESFVLESRNCDVSRVAHTSRAPSQLDQMLADSILPANIQPNSDAKPNGLVNSILLTGATGFLGAYLLRALLRDTTADVYCLVRPSTSDSLDRIRNNLEHYGIWEQEFARRIHPVEGDLQEQSLGLSERLFERLADNIDEIYHCGAAVNWVFPYEGLRDANVLGTRELLRFACTGTAKPFHFVSTMATCYSSSREEEVTEQEDMLPYLNSIHLGYAQSKCVAEALVRSASRRGLPATIHRPTLISGDSSTGFSNEEDLLSNMIRGCIEMGLSPDLNWVLDCCPVDFTADAIVGLSRQPNESLRVFHLANRVSRRWREVVLWINLYGYPLKLVPYREWLTELRTSATTPSHPLYRLRSFFLARPDADSDLTLPELYEQHRRCSVSHVRTRQVLSENSYVCPSLDARLLEQYFDSFIERNILPRVATENNPSKRTELVLDSAFFEDVLREHYKDGTVQIHDVTMFNGDGQESITTELTSWQQGNVAGLRKFRLGLKSNNDSAPPTLDLFVKVKPHSDEVLTVAEKVAALCDTDVGQAFSRHSHQLEVAGSHLREIEIYRQQDDRFRSHVPNVFGTIENTNDQQWELVLESLSGLELLDSANDAGSWQPAHIEAAIRGIAQIHSIWYEREHELSEKSWLGPKMTAGRMVEMTDLWESLHHYSWNYFSEWLPADDKLMIAGLVTDAGKWWRSVEQMPHTLIHNDFNPRNMAFRNQDGGYRLCVYDWELASLGIPQHDLAELLCFVLTEDCPAETVLDYIDLHRHSLSAATGQTIDGASWRLGVQLALQGLIVNRFPMYCLMHTFRSQPFLSRVVKNWRRLRELLVSQT